MTQELGLVMAGDWDLNTIPFESLDIFQACKQRFKEGGAWSQSQFYNRIRNDIQHGRARWSCKTIDEFDERLIYLEHLYHDFKENGYRTEVELQACSPYGHHDEIIVHIGRNGDYIFTGGRHRLSIAKLAGIEKVPVKVARRHANWVKFFREILAYAQERNVTATTERSPGHIYHPISHPDLRDIPSSHSTQRMDIIRGHVPPGGGRLLDIGANLGFFAVEFERLGFDCTAVEIRPREAYFLRKLRRAENCTFKIVEASILDLNISQMYDVVLALNIFHHFLKDKVSYGKLVDFLQRLNTRMLFFQPHLANEKQMASAYKRYSESEFVEFVQNQGRLTKKSFLGRDGDGRGIYKLER